MKRVAARLAEGTVLMLEELKFHTEFDPTGASHVASWQGRHHYPPAVGDFLSRPSRLILRGLLRMIDHDKLVRGNLALEPESELIAHGLEDGNRFQAI